MTTKIKSGVISDNAITSAHISSGAISSAHLSSIDTDAVSEGSSNLYFTTARARTSFSITDSGGDGSLAYDNSTGVITYTGPSASEVRAHISVTDSGGDGSLAYSNGVITYTGPSASEVRAHLSAGTGVTYSSGEISIGQSVATTASPTFADINITGDLNLTGDINSYSVTDLDIVDQTITLGVGQSESASDGSGIVIAGSSASILWDEPNDEFDFNKGINVTGNITGTLATAAQTNITSVGTLSALTVTGDANFDSGTLFVDVSANNVGVGASTINEKLEVKGAIGFQASNSTNRWSAYTYTDNTFRLNYNGVGADEVTLTSSGNFGIGTTSPTSWASYTDTAATVLQVQDTSQRARIVINGGNGAHLDLVDYAGGTDDKHLNFAVDGGIAKFGSLNDAGNSFITNNILTMDLGNGSVGIGTNSVGNNSKLDIYGGSMQIINTGATEGTTADASLHIKGAEPTQDRLIQMSAVGTSKKALNLIASTDASDAAQWWSWGVDTDDEFKILHGIGFSDSNVGIRINDAGSVGIGISSMDQYTNLTVYDANYGGMIWAGHANASGTFPKVSALSLGSDAVSYGHTTNNGTVNLKGSAQIAAIQSQSSGAYTDMAFYTTANGSVTEKMRIHNSGKLGIGTDTTTPTGKLTIANPTAYAPNTITAANTYIQLGSTDYGSGGSSSNDGKFMIGFGYTDGATNTHSPAYIGFEETSTSGDTKGALTFYTRDVITDTAPTERMRIDSSGTVGISQGSPSSTYKLDVGGPIRSTGNAPSYTLREDDASSQTWLMASYGGTFAVRDTTVSGTAYPFQIQAATPSNTLFLKSDGNVGIGTSAPAYKLDISGTSGDGTPLIRGTVSNTPSAGFNWATEFIAANLPDDKRLTHIWGKARTTYGMAHVSYLPKSTASESYLALGLWGANDILNVLGNGNVGIGTTTPFSSAKLQVNTGTNLNLAVQTGTTITNGMKINAFNDAGSANIPLEINGSVMLLKTGETERMRIDSSGNVGVGINPQGKFHVSGGRMGVIASNSYASWGHFRIANTSDAEISMAYITGATESDFLNDGDPACAYKVVTGINAYGAGNRNFAIGNDTMANYHTMWTEAGHQLPRANNTFDLGSASNGYRNIYTNDLNLSNMPPEGVDSNGDEYTREGNEVDGTNGSWTMQEGADDLFLINRRNGRKYKFKLEEVL